ncbi:ParB family chromosome partitioning protein [Desulfohalotomaculum tongense]|uniref:ParB/RepB/Spo0J family partition protein n=1 Tax=Desulforadius tongensis TaxID=1216062 RepID=UPI001957A011|nr:ParB/RepB/Spo0J family partition protein [Desulforadius tongensis]MBM7855810.1 ParB family chromosome partitioning protein [Desulforadius tongensis]
MSKKMGLGKGLQALIPSYNKENKKTLRNILVADIKPNPKQPRQDMNKEKLQELADSIQEHGVVQPVVVRELPEGGYQLIAGERRWRACQLANIDTIPAVVTEYTDVEAAEVALIENLQREDLNPLEESVAYQSLINEFGLTQEELAKRVGKSRSYITNMLRLLSLPDEVLAMLSGGRLSVGHARALLAIKDDRKKITAAREIVKKQLSVRQTEKLVKNLENKKEKSRRFQSCSPELEDLKDQLQSVFGTKVQIKTNKKGKGKLEIEFYSEDDLARIMDILLNTD